MMDDEVQYEWAIKHREGGPVIDMRSETEARGFANVVNNAVVLRRTIGPWETVDDASTD